MAELLTSKQLAEKAGVDPRLLRRLIRKEFAGVGTVQVEGEAKQYRFNPDDPMTQRIIDRAKGGKVKAEKAVKTEKPKAKKVGKVQAKANIEAAKKIPAGKLSKAPKGQNSPVRIIHPTETPKQVADRLAPAKLQKVGVKVKPSPYAVYDEKTGEVEVIGGQEPKGETGA